MVVIRLARGGSKKNPFYQIVVTDCRHPRDGRFIEHIGYYNPMVKGHNVMLKVEKERIVHWLNQGAQATLRVQYLIKKLEKSVKRNKDNLCKSELEHLQFEQQSAKSQKAQVKVTEKVNAEEAKAEEVPVAK